MPKEAFETYISQKLSEFHCWFLDPCLWAKRDPMKSPLSVGRYVLEEICVATTIETLSLLLDIKGEHTLLILIYRPLGTIHSFVIDLIQLIEYVLFTVNFNRNNELSRQKASILQHHCYEKKPEKYERYRKPANM